MLSLRTSPCLALALAAGFACGYAPAAKAAEAAKAADFLNSLGVATHLNYTDGTYANYETRRQTPTAAFPTRTTSPHWTR
jgi:hypothetical protein